MLILALSGAFTSFAGDYDNVIVYSLTNAAGYENDTITVQLNIDENPGLWSFWVLIYYDMDTFNLTKVEYNSELLENGTFEKTTDNQMRRDLAGGAAELVDSLVNYNIDNTNLAYKVIMFDSNDLYNDVMFTGTAATLTFTIQGLSDEGDYTIGAMPMPENSINCNDELLDARVTNAIVRVGSDKVPTETQKSISPLETLDPSEITEPAETISREDLESRALDGSDAVTEVETFVGEDGKTYTYDENGETVEYVEPESDTETEPEDIATEDGATEDVETVPDVVESGADEKSSSTVNLFGKDVKLVYIIGAALLLLALIAAILAVIIVRTKKKTEKIDEEENKDEE